MHTTPFLDLASSFFKCHQIKMLNSHWSIAPVSSDSRLFLLFILEHYYSSHFFWKVLRIFYSHNFYTLLQGSKPSSRLHASHLSPYIPTQNKRDPNATVVHTEENNHILSSGEPLTNFTIQGHKINSSRNWLVSTNWQPKEPISPRASQPQHRFKVTL